MEKLPSWAQVGNLLLSSEMQVSAVYFRVAKIDEHSIQLDLLYQADGKSFGLRTIPLSASDELSKFSLLTSPTSEAEEEPEFDCETCQDTHRIIIRGSKVLCTHCPAPCSRCSASPNLAWTPPITYCGNTPCACECHKKE